MPPKVLVIDTSILCVWLRIPGKTTCGPAHDKWDYTRVDGKLRLEEQDNTIFVLPLATIIETGNHISQAPGDRKTLADSLGKIMQHAADNTSPWAAFSDQSELWSAAQLGALAVIWPPLAAQKLSLGDATIREVAEFYARTGCHVELLTGDHGLKAYEPAKPATLPRRRARP